jgi:integrase
MNDNLLRIAERYDFNIPEISDVILNRYIKDILKRLSEEVPSLQKTEITKLTMREREMEERGDAEFMRNEDGDVIKYRYDLVTSHTARRSGITNLYLTGLFDTVQMMSISGHKDQRTFFDYIKLSSDEIADKIMEKLRQSENVGNEGLF